MQIRNAVLYEGGALPPLGDLMYQFIVAGNGLFIRAEDSRMEAIVPVCLQEVYGLPRLDTFARLKVPRIPSDYLWSVLASARRHSPNEAMYQFCHDPGATRSPGVPWRVVNTTRRASAAALEFADEPNAVVDLHSHAALTTFFSTTDDEDEKGFRFYCVIGQVETSQPTIVARVGVYGHTMNVPVETIFTGPGPFTQTNPDVEWGLSDEKEIADIVELSGSTE